MLLVNQAKEYQPPLVEILMMYLQPLILHLHDQGPNLQNRMRLLIAQPTKPFCIIIKRNTWEYRSFFEKNKTFSLVFIFP